MGGERFSRGFSAATIGEADKRRHEERRKGERQRAAIIKADTEHKRRGENGQITSFLEIQQN